MSTLLNRNNFLRWTGSVAPVLDNYTLNNDQLDISSTTNQAESIYVSPDGTKVYVSSTNEVYEFTLSTPFKLSTGSFTTSQTMVGSDFRDTITFNNDGTKFYKTEYNFLGSTVYITEFELGSAYDLSTLVSTTGSRSGNLYVSNEIYNSISFNDDGTEVYLTDSQNDEIAKYSGFVAFDATDIVAGDLEYNTSISGTDNEPTSINYFDGDLYVYGNQNNLLYKFNDSTGSPVLSDSFTFGSTINPSQNFISFVNTAASNYVFLMSLNDDIIYSFSDPEFDAPQSVTEYGNETQYDDIENYAVAMKPGDLLRFYGNLTLPENTAFQSLRADLKNMNGDIVAFDVLTLKLDQVSAGNNRFYCDDGSIPNVVSGCYYFSLVDYDGDELYTSNFFKISTVLPYTKKIRFRNPDDILNYNYETLTTFKNEFRINLVKRQPSYSTASTGYTLIDGSFNRVRTTTGMEFDFITENYNDLDHEAWNAATIQELEVFNDDVGQWETFKRSEDAAYEVDWQDNYPFADGTIKLEQENTYNSSKNV